MLKNRKKKGFTLIELIVVIAILGILAAVLIPKFSGFQSKAHSTQALVEAKQFATAADAYLVEHDIANSTALTTGAGSQVAAIAETAGVDAACVTGATTNSDSTHVLFTYSRHAQTATREADGTFTLAGTYDATVTP